MKHSLTQPKTTALSCIAIAALLFNNLAPSPVQAASDTWTGGGAPDGNWQTANNWGGIAPQALDFLFFDGTAQTLATNDFAAGTIFGNVTFNSTADPFTLFGNSLTLTNGSDNGVGSASGGGITNSSANTETINLPITLSAGRHNIAAIGGGQLNLNGAVTRNTGAVVSFNTVGGNINVTGGLDTNGFNNILGGWAILGNDWATLDANSNVVAFTGYTDISTGAIANNPASNVRFSSDSGNLTAATGTTINSILCNITTARNITITGVMKLGSRGGIYRTAAGTQTPTITGGFLTANGGGEITVLAQPGTASGSVVISSIITNDGPANVVSVNVFGYITLNGNTYTGGTYINQGRVTYNAANAYGTGPVFVFPGGETFQNGANCTNALFLSGTGSVESNGGITGPGALRLSGRTQSGRVTLRGPTRITTSSAGTATIISGQITGTGPLEIATFATASSQMLLSNAGTPNDWTGGLLLSSLAASRDVYLRLGANNQIPDGASAGNVTINGVVTARLDLNGFSDTINGLIATNSVNNQVANYGTVPSTLTLGNNNATATFNGIIQDGTGTNAASNLSITKIGTGTQTFTGANTYRGTNTVTGGTLVFGAGSFPVGTPAVTVNSNATLDVSAVTPLALAAVSTLSMSNGTVVVGVQSGSSSITTSNLTANGTTNIINVGAIGAISTYPAQMTAIKYTTLTGTLNFGLGTLPLSPGTPYAAYVSNNVANSSVDVVITAGPTSIKWQGYSGGAPNSTWDIASTLNWVTFGGVATTYSDGSFVQFDNSASNGVATLVQDVAPAGITVTNTSLAYTINGGNKITGAGGLLKQGSGTLTLDNTGANDFTGGVTVSGGTLQFGNNDSGGNLPSGSIIDNAALVFARNDTVTVPNVIAGTGTVSQNGSGSTLILNAANTFTGAVTVLQGTLQAGNNSALGTTNGGTTVASGATLEIVANAINLGQEPITISGAGVGGAGALVNNSGSLTFVVPNAARLTLAGDATVGGSGRFDLRSATTSDPKLASLSTLGQPRKVTKVGTGTFGFIGITVDPALGDIEVQQGIFSTEAAMTGLGNVASNLTVWPGGTLQMFAITNQLNKVITLGGDGIVNSVSATSGTGNTIIGPMNITNDCIFNVNNAAVSLNLNNVLTGPGKITKVGLGLLTVSGNSPAYAGGFQVNNGSLTINGTLVNTVGATVVAGKFTLNGALLGGTGLTNAAVSTIAGSGTNFGPADISGILNPGDTNVVGTLTVSNLTLESGATLNYDLGSNNSPGGNVNDLIVVNGDLTVNANAITINPVGLLKTGAGNPYRLFNYTGILIMTNGDLTVSGPNNYVFAVDTNTVGQVNVVVSGGPPVWDGGSASTSNWNDPANWGGVTINSGDSLFFNGPGRLSNVNNTPADTTYTDLNFVSGAGAFTLNGNPIMLGGNVINNSSNPQTVDLGLDFNGTHTLNGASGPLIIGGGVNYNANPSTLVLAGTGTLTNLLGSADPSFTNTMIVTSNANWSLMDNGSSMIVTNPVELDMQAGTFNFGNAGSAPNLTCSSIINSRLGVVANAPAILNMVNGTLTFAARLNTGTAGNSIATINQSGGTLNAQSLFQGADGSSAAISTVNITGGTFNVGVPTRATFFLSSRGTGTVTVASSGAINCGTLDVSRGISSGIPSTVNLNSGGTISATRVGTASSASVATATGDIATFNFNGGTILAAASSTTFFQGNPASPAIPIIAIVKSGGAIIDTTNFNISILEPLQHDANLGATADGGLIKNGVGTLTVGANGTYTGGTLVNNGTLAVNATLGATTVIVATNATLSGTGTAGTNVIVNGGGTLSPAGANTIGTLTVAGSVTLQSNSTNFMELNKSLASNDRVRATAAAATTITYAGTLSLTNLAGTLVASDTFKLFSATNYSGSFDAIIPAIPAPGLAWDVSTLATDGTLRFTATVNTTPTNITATVSGNQLTLSWPADHTGWRLQVQTNSVNTGLASNWVDVAGSATVNSITVTIDPANGTVFYRMVYP